MKRQRNGGAGLFSRKASSLSVLVLLFHSGHGFLQQPGVCPERRRVTSSEIASGWIRWGSTRFHASASIGMVEDGDSARITILLDDVDRLQAECLRSIQSSDFRMALRKIQKMVDVLSENRFKGTDRLAVSEKIDRVVQSLSDFAFVKPFSDEDYERVSSGLNAINLQINARSGVLASPFHTTPKRRLGSAIQAMSQLVRVSQATISHSRRDEIAEATFRILQRLLTGVGMRERLDERRHAPIYEKDIYTVLNMFSEIGRMDLARKAVSLQERTEHAPPLSAVTFSILLKGYGRLGDVERVDEVIEMAKNRAIEPDTILLNSVIDTYVNVDAIEKAEAVFSRMCDSSKPRLFSGYPNPPPNGRTFNAMLKGYARNSRMKKALQLVQVMDKQGLRDAVTTNLLVHAAIVSGNTPMAKSILSANTEKKSPRKPQHPNVEAYTELLDAYGRSGKLKEAIETISVMKKKGVQPNVHTYACLASSFGRQGRLKEAMSTIEVMERSGIPATVVVYNSLITSLLESYDPRTQEKRMDDSLGLLRHMETRGIRPNTVTVSNIVGGLTKCEPPRVDEATQLVGSMISQGLVSETDPIIASTLIKAFGAVGDIKGALKAFRTLKKPDVTAVNAFMTVCSHSNNSQMTRQTFTHFFGEGKLMPSMISYSILVCSLLSSGRSDARGQAVESYARMKREGTEPDREMVDGCLRPLLKLAQSERLADTEVRFIIAILRDAETLAWPPGQLERRWRAARYVLPDRLDELVGDGLERFATDDELFQKHGWNQVDSGFRLWNGAPKVELSSDSKIDDFFLQSKGWNDVDSGFRII